MMYGADLDRLRYLLGRFDMDRQVDWDPLLVTVHDRLKGIFWIGPDRDRAIAAIMDMVAGPVAVFLDDIDTARSMLADGISRQNHASRGPSGSPRHDTAPDHGRSGIVR